MGEFARLLILFGVVSIGVGVVLLAGPRLPFVGKLPGDFLLQRENATIYVPLATLLVVSIVLTVLLNLFLR